MDECLLVLVFTELVQAQLARAGQDRIFDFPSRRWVDGGVDPAAFRVLQLAKHRYAQGIGAQGTVQNVN